MGMDREPSIYDMIYSNTSCDGLYFHKVKEVVILIWSHLGLPLKLSMCTYDYGQAECYTLILRERDTIFYCF